MLDREGNKNQSTETIICNSYNLLVQKHLLLTILLSKHKQHEKETLDWAKTWQLYLIGGWVSVFLYLALTEIMGEELVLRKGEVLRKREIPSPVLNQTLHSTLNDTIQWSQTYICTQTKQHLV